MQNNKRLVTISYVGIAIICWLLVRQIAGTIWGIAKLPLPQDWPITPADLIGAVAAVVLYVIFSKHPKINQFADEVVSELSKVTWPPKKETLLSAGVVSIMIGICALILFGFDTLWGTVVKLLYQ